MHPTPVQRVPVKKAHTTCTMLLSSSRTPLHLRSTITRTSRPTTLQARTLWWWSRHGSEWQTPDKGLEERLQRYEKIMKYRYSKALRRRRMWDLDEHICRPAWGWRLPSRWMGSRWADYKNLSSSQTLQANVHDGGKEDRKDPWPWDEWEKKWNKDYEAFKKAVDKAIARDPYGTLFGRHLRSPPTTNNSSWTSFSWIFEPKGENGTPKTDPTPEKVEKQAEKVQSDSRTQFSVPPRSSTNVIQNKASTLETEYEYDPISMRKVPKTKSEEPAVSSEMNETSEAKPFLSSLFSEHGVDIPVRTYKPHKVYGFDPTATRKKETSQTPDSEKPKASKKGFESSRLRELQNLKAVTLGTNIDTTAEYGGKYQVSEEQATTSELDTPQPKKVRVAEVEDNAPLFSGTTYQSKSEEILVKPKDDWLLKEGFRTSDQALQPEPTSNSTTKVAVTAVNKGMQGKLESSLDRLQRATGPASVAEKSPKDASEIEQREDIDLLRASDVRAAARTTRITKQEAEQHKKDARQKLEKDYASREQDKNDTARVVPDQSKDTSSKLSKSFNNVWKHVREFPQGIVAKTMKSMGFMDINDIKNEQREPRSARVAASGTATWEVCDAEKESMARTAALKQATADAKKDEALKQQQARELAAQLRTEYEDQYGLIDVHHRQVIAPLSDAEQSKVPAAPVEKKDPAVIPAPSEDEDSGHSAEVAATSRYFEGQSLATPLQKKSHPLQTASVKPGVEKDPVIEQHVTTFEPKIAEIVDRLKQLRHNLREVSLHVKAVKSKRPLTYWNAVQEKEPEKNPTAVSGSSGDSTSSPSLPTYLFLAYSPATDNVVASSMSSKLLSQMPAAPKSVDFADVLTKLNNPAKFIAHFDQLQKEGYKLLRGGTNSLIFKRTKPEDSPTATSEVSPAALASKTAELATPSEKLNQIASEEASAQPESTLQPSTSITPNKEAAEVLDEIPREINPAPGPAAPTAPPSTPPAGHHHRSHRRAIRRQESVFSGQRVPNTKSLSNKELPAAVVAGEITPLQRDQAHYKQQDFVQIQPKVSHSNEEGTKQKQREQESLNRPGFFARLRRTARRVVLTGLAMAGFAYAVGVVTEGVGAGQERDKRGKRVVMNTNGNNAGMRGSEERKYVGRPGIYSTENSR